MKNGLFFNVLTAILLTFSIVGCQKEVVGPTGPAGQNGIDGINGQNGNANVVGTNPITITTSNWQYSNSVWGVGLNVPAITSDIANFGMVQVFVLTGNQQWTALPNSIGTTIEKFYFEPGRVDIYYYDINFAAVSNPGNRSYRIVAISSTQIKQNPNVDWNNYQQAVKALNLE